MYGYIAVSPRQVGSGWGGCLLHPVPPIPRDRQTQTQTEAEAVRQMPTCLTRWPPRAVNCARSPLYYVTTLLTKNLDHLRRTAALNCEGGARATVCA